MDGKHGYHGPSSGSDSNLSNAEPPLPGPSSRKKKRRVSLLGKRKNIAKPVPFLSTLREELEEDERSAHSYGDDVSLKLEPSDVPCAGGDRTLIHIENLLHHSDERTVGNLEGQCDSTLYSQCDMELTDSLGKLEVDKQLPHTDHPQGWPEICEKVVSDCQDIKLKTNKENVFHVPAKKLRINEKPRYEFVSFCKPVMKETTPSFGDVISLKQVHQTVVAESQPGCSYKSSSKTVQEYSAECQKEFYPVTTQAMQASRLAKPLREQVQNVDVTPAERLNNYITVSGKGYRVMVPLGKGGSSEVFKVEDSNSKQTLAMKCVDLSSTEPSVAQGYLNETELLRRLQGSDTVIRMIDWVRSLAARPTSYTRGLGCLS